MLSRKTQYPLKCCQCALFLVAQLRKLYISLMEADYELQPDGSVRSHGHGGARANSGTKPKGYQKAPEVVDFDKARARNEAAKADLNEIEYKIKSGEYVSRFAVQQAAATAVSAFAQTMRSVPDNLERKGVPPEVCALIEQVIDESMAGLADDLELMSGGPS